MDEPTNHMDIPSREAIEEALERYPGTVLLISHDRYLLDRLMEKLWIVEDRRITVSQGGFSLFRRTLLSSRSPGGNSGAGNNGGGGELLGRAKKRGKEREKAASGTGNRSSDGGISIGREREIRRLEKRIEELEGACRRIEGDMEGAFHRGDHRKGRTLGTELGKTRKILEEAYRSWEGMAE